MKAIRAALLVGVVALMASTARADLKSCLQSARDTYAGCKTGCKNAFIDDKANCRGITPGCLSDCIDQRTTCLANAEAPLDSCYQQLGCDDYVTNAKPGCSAQCSCGGNNQPPCRFDSCYVGCLDPYEQQRFSCRDTCRNQWQLNGGPQAVSQCRADFQQCIAAPDCVAQ